MLTAKSQFFARNLLITDISATLIDNIFFNSLEHFAISGNFLIIDKFSTLSSKIKIYKRASSKLNEQALGNEVQSVDWEEDLAEVSNPTSLFDSFYNIFISYRRQTCSRKRAVEKRKKSTAQAMANKRHKNIYNVFKTKIDFIKSILKKYQFNFDRFKFYRNKINHLTRISKRQYYNNYFQTNNDNGKLIWKGIKQIVKLNNNCFTIPTKITENNKELKDLKEIAKAFCK